MTYEQMYLKYGFKKIQHFLSPIVVKSTTFKFPRSSSLCITEVSDIPVNIKKINFPYLSKQDKAVVKPIYTMDNKSDVKKDFSVRVDDLIRKNKEEELSYNFLSKTKKVFNVKPDELMIYHTGYLNALHRYKASPLSNYTKVKYALEKTVDSILSKENNFENKFITMNVPYVLPSRSSLVTNTKSLKRSYLNSLTDKSELILLEFWKFMTEDTKEASIFNKIPEYSYKDINIIFTISNKLIIVNMDKMMRFSTLVNLESKVKYKEKAFKNLFYNMLYSLVERVEVNNEEEISIDSGKKEFYSTDINNEKIEEDKLNNIINEDIIENDDDLNDEDMVLDTEDLDNIVDVAELTEEERISLNLERYKENKLISTNSYNSTIDILTEQENINSFYDKDLRLTDALDYTKDDIVIDDKITKTPSNSVTFDKRYTKDVITALDKKYIKNNYKKDMVRAIYSLQNDNYLVEDASVETKDSILGGTDEIVIKVKNMKNSQKASVKFIIPKLEEDGTFKVSGNSYRMRKQRADLPIRKINFNEVVLSSNAGKLFITKATSKNVDFGYYINKKLTKMYKEDLISKYLAIPSLEMDTKLPRYYMILSRYIKTFTYGDYEFNFYFKDRYKILNIDKDIVKEDIKNNKILCGKYKRKPIYMDEDGYLYTNDKELGLFTDLLEIDMTKSPIEYANIAIYSAQIPLVMVLIYYSGIKSVLKKSGIKYRISEEKRPKVNIDEYSIKFKDRVLIITKDSKDLLFGGLKANIKLFKDVNLKDLNTTSGVENILHQLGVNLKYLTKIKVLENMYIDKLTESNLYQMKEPTKFVPLLYRTIELLVNDSYTNPNDIKGMSIKGYERIPGMLYNELFNAILKAESESHFGKSKLTVNPYNLKDRLGSDPTTVLIQDNNPVSFLKQREEVTYTGDGGRNKATMTKNTRIMNPSEIGVISEATKDSGDVGVSAYMSAIPNIKNTKGITSKYDFKDQGWSSVLSTSALLAPFAITDDVKRLNFSNIQNSHVIPLVNSKVPYVRTGYEGVFADKLPDKFVVNAQESGKVIKVTNDVVVVEYKSGVKKHKYADWTSKEESNSCYVHEMKSNVQKGDKIQEGDVIIYDSSFFEPDMFNEKSVLYKQGIYTRVGLFEERTTYEDSTAIHKNTSDLLKIKIRKVNSTVITMDRTLINLVKIGEKVEPGDKLFTTMDPMFNNENDLDDKTKAVISDIQSDSPKAKNRGIVKDIVVMYNCDIKSMSETIKSLVEKSDSKLKHKHNYGGRVNSSYSIEGEPLPEGHIEIKIYIETKEDASIEDKIIYGNQLKCTVGDVFDYERIDGMGNKLDAIFSYRALSARIVLSPYLTGTTAALLDHMGKEAYKLYTNKKSKKEITEYIVNNIDKLVPGGENKALYVDFFKDMNANKFNLFMESLNTNERHLQVIITNDMVNRVTVKKNLALGKKLGYQFFSKIKSVGNSEGDYLTPNEYLVLLLPTKRTLQTMDKGLSTPYDDKSIDVMSGQVTGKSRSSKITLPEIQILKGNGLDKTLTELTKTRGGDLGEARALNKLLYSKGSVTQEELEKYSTGVVSKQTLKAYLLASHIESTL